MSTQLPTIVDYLVTLLEATASNVTRAIPGTARARFKHAPSGIAGKLSAAATGPYPFEILDGGRVQPQNTQSTLSGDQLYDGRRLLVRVGYANQPHDLLARLKIMQADDYQIRRTLNHQRSWDGCTPVAVASVDDGTIEPMGVDRADGEPDIMWVVEIPVIIDYREDHTDG